MLSFIGNIGGLIATFPLAMLIKGMGWRYSLLFMGILCICVAITIHIYVKNSPRDYGYEARGAEELGEAINISSAVKDVVRNSATWRNFFTLFSLVGCTTSLTGLWGVNYLINVYGMTKTTAAFYIAFVVYGFVLGSLFIGRVEALFKENVMVYPRIASILISICWGYILFIAKGKPPVAVIPAIFLMMGFLAMSHILAFTDMNMKCDEKSSGLATSIVNSGEFIGSSIISILIGVILDFGWKGEIINGARHYEAIQYISGFYMFLIFSILGVITSFIGDNRQIELKEEIKVEI